MRKQIQAISKSLHVKDVAVGASYLAHGAKGFAEIGRAQFDALRMQTFAKFIRRADLQDLAEVNQGDAMAPLRFIEIGSGNQHGEALAGEVSERVPKLPPRHGIHACRRFIQQQDIRLGNERAHQRQLLLHAAAQLGRQPLGEAVHVKHFQIAAAALVDFRGRNVPQFADVADVFAHAQVGIEAERLGEISGPRTPPPVIKSRGTIIGKQSLLRGSRR